MATVYLIDDPAVAGDKAFNWQQEFPEVFAKGRFDVVIGNPPYGASFNDKEKKYLSNFKTYKYRFESYVYFFESGINLLKTGGFLGYITPELWLNLENCLPLRSLIFNAVDLIEINIVGENVFIDAVVNTVITILSREKKREAFAIVDKDIKWNLSYDSWGQNQMLSIEYRINSNHQKIINRIDENSTPLNEIGKVIQGITPYDKYRGQDPKLIKKRAYHFNYKKDDSCGKWLNGDDVNRYSLTWGGEWLSYGQWLAAPREKIFFEGPRLIFREIPGRSRRIQASLIEEIAYYGHSITPFVLKDRYNIQILKMILCFVNSELFSWYGNLKLPNFGKQIFPKMNPQDIKLLPIPKINQVDQIPFVSKADIMLFKNKELQQLKLQLLQLLQSKYENLALSKKLQDWPTLSFKEFLKELDKQKIKLTLPEQAEWMHYFEAEKTKANSIQQLLAQTDKEIDQMVYTLYSLTEEEQKIVEAG